MTRHPNFPFQLRDDEDHSTRVDKWPHQDEEKKFGLEISRVLTAFDEDEDYDFFDAVDDLEKVLARAVTNTRAYYEGKTP